MSFFWAVESSSPNIWEKASLTFILVNALLPRFYGHFMILHAIQLYGNVTKLGGIDAAALELSLQSHHFSCIHIHIRDAAGHYPTRATRPVTRPVLNRPNYPYYPWPAGIWTIFDPTRPDPWKPMKIITRWPVTFFYVDPLDPWEKLPLTRITRDIFSRDIFTKSETFWSKMPIFGQI